MWVKVEDAVFRRYSNAVIGYLVAEVVVKKEDPVVEALKQELKGFVKERGIDPTTFVTHPSVALWRRIYEEDFQVKAKTYRSSLEALLRRVVTGKELWNICSVVDLYNCSSIRSLLPMGAYDLAKVSEGITIRYGREGEMFVGLGTREKIEVKPHHIVYADEEEVICWLWNHKDAEKTCIDESSKCAVFFIDGFSREEVQKGLELLAEDLKKIGCIPCQSGMLDKMNVCADLTSCVSR